MECASLVSFFVFDVENISPSARACQKKSTNLKFYQKDYTSYHRVRIYQDFGKTTNKHETDPDTVTSVVRVLDQH